MTGRRFAYAGVIVGLVVSIAANIAHAAGQPGGASIWALGMSGFWPVALFLALEVLTRNEWARGRGVVVARAGVVAVALVAAALSYWHLRGLLITFGEQAWSATLGPLGVDGLMTVSAAALLTGHAPADVLEPTSPRLEDVDQHQLQPMSEPARPAVAAARQERDPKPVTARARTKPTSRKPTDDDLAALLRAAIAAGDLPSAPSNNAVRIRYGVNNARAVRVINRATAPLEATS